MCTYFHTTNKPLQVGENFSIDMFEGDTTIDHTNRCEEQKKTNDIFDKYRPNGVLSRKKCIYLFSNLSQCKKYANNKGYQYIYEVKCNDEVFGPYPMTLVTSLAKNPENMDIVNEYWSPTKSWKVFEFLTSSIVVLQIIPFEHERIFIDDYIVDRELSLRYYT